MVDRPPALRPGWRPWPTVDEAVDWLTAISPSRVSSARTPTSRTGRPGVKRSSTVERGRLQRGGVGRRLRQRHAAGLRGERGEPHLDAHARGGPALGPHVVGDAAGERDGGRAHVRPFGEVGREGLLAAVRARDPRLARAPRPGRSRAPAARTRGPAPDRARRRARPGRRRPARRTVCSPRSASFAAVLAPMPHSARVGRWPITSAQFSAVSVNRPPGLPNSVAILARSRLSPIPTAQDSRVSAATAAWIRRARSSAASSSATVAPTNASSQPMHLDASTPGRTPRSTAMTCSDAASYAGLSAGRNTASGSGRAPCAAACRTGRRTRARRRRPWRRRRAGSGPRAHRPRPAARPAPGAAGSRPPR